MNELADCHRSFVVVGKYTISDKIQITTCLVLTFRQMFITGDNCTNLLTDMEKVQWKPPWLSMQQNYAHHRLQMMHAATIIKFMGSLLCSAEKSQGPWVPGGFKSGLRPSCILSGGECHVLGQWMGLQAGLRVDFQGLRWTGAEGIKSREWTRSPVAASPGERCPPRFVP